jgi:cation:H+ antiporter
MDILLLLVGIVFALVGAQLLVNGGVAVAGRFGIPTLVIGATVVGFGTSMPELTVNVTSALGGNTDLALGNILGSNMFNVCMILGIVALITPMAISKDSQGKDLPMCLLSAIMVGIAGNQLYLDHINYHELMLSSGLTFLLFFCVFMKYVWAEAACGKGHHDQAKARTAENGDDMKGMSVARSITYIILGLIGLVAGGELIVDGATGVARSFGMTERVIGLVIVGPGTSVPELVASIVAARKKQAAMVIGNVLGSNIFNVFFTLGVTAMICPVPLDLALNTVVLFNIGVSLFLVLFAWFWPRKQFGRGVGALLLVAYIAYLVQSISG